MQFVNFLIALLSTAVAIPVITLMTQVLLAVIFKKITAESLNLDFSANVVVLIPAHNESKNLIPTLNSIRNQTLQAVDVLVVADNCEDDTAQVANAHGAIVIERTNQAERGKGYALDFGIQHLSAQQAPDYVVIVDADCILEKDALEQLIAASVRSSNPIQANYLMRNVGNPSIKMKIAEFAWMLKNFVRPLGFHRLGLPCQLTGSGMAFRWDVISKLSFATGHIVEDMKLGLDFAEIGNAPQFCPSAYVYSFFPTNEEGIKTQRTRWEHGHLGIMFKDVPRILVNAIKDRNLNLLAMALDLFIPPLSLMAMFLLLCLILSACLSFVSMVFSPLLLTVSNLLVIFSATIIVYWGVYGRQIISLSQLLLVPYYIFLKLPIYLKFVFNRQSEWVRSKRD